MAKPQRDPQTNRFAPSTDVHSLFAYVRDVAVAANPSEPWTVSKRAFDAARRADERLAGGLSADGVLRRLRYPWTELLAVVTDPARDPERSIASHNRRDLRPVISIEEATAALKLIAERLGVRTLRRQEYDRARQELVDRDAAAWLHGRRLDRTLPTADQIERAFRLNDPPLSWDDGLRRAGLDVRAAAGGPAGVTWPELIDMFIDELGYVPAWHQAKDYAAAKNISVERNRGLWNDHLKAVRVLRRQRGVLMPRRRVPGRLDVSGLAPAPGGAPRRRRGPWSYDECLDGLVLALTAAGSWPLTLRRLKELAKTDPAIPSYSTLQRGYERHGWPPFPELRAEAARRLSEQTRSDGT